MEARKAIKVKKLSRYRLQICL